MATILVGAFFAVYMSLHMSLRSFNNVWRDSSAEFRGQNSVVTNQLLPTYFYGYSELPWSSMSVNVLSGTIYHSAHTKEILCWIVYIGIFLVLKRFIDMG